MRGNDTRGVPIGSPAGAGAPHGAGDPISGWSGIDEVAGAFGRSH